MKEEIGFSIAMLSFAVSVLIIMCGAASCTRIMDSQNDKPLVFIQIERAKQ